MVLGFHRNQSAKDLALPWGSIDPREGVQPTQWDAPSGEKSSRKTPSGGKWFLDSPPADWKMEPPQKRASGCIDEADEDNLKTPFESVADADEFGGEVGEEETYPPRETAETGAWTISVLCMGLGLIAACILIPQADANRRLVYAREQLRLELQNIQQQTSVNREFLTKMEVDPQLTERLAQREMRAVEQGEAVVNVNGDAGSASGATAAAERMSPFTLVKVPPPPALEPYQPVGGTFADLCRNPGTHMYVLGTGMIMVAGGLVLGGPAKKEEDVAEEINAEA
jgi:hypothetical protein